MIKQIGNDLQKHEEAKGQQRFSLRSLMVVRKFLFGCIITDIVESV